MRFRITVTDGPFTESKEVVGGFAMIQATSKEEAVKWTRRFIEVAGDGESEIRQGTCDSAIELGAHASMELGSAGRAMGR